MTHPPRGTCVPGCELYGVCHCGCGERTTIAPTNHAPRGHVGGRPMAYRNYHSPGLKANRLAHAGNGHYFHNAEVPVRRVRPLVEFLMRDRTQRELSAMLGCSSSSISRILVDSDKRTVKPALAGRIVEAVTAQRPRHIDPWATFDTEQPRQPTEWESARAEMEAAGRYAENRKLKKFAVKNQHDGVSALDKKARDRVYQRQRRAS